MKLGKPKYTTDYPRVIGIFTTHIVTKLDTQTHSMLIQQAILYGFNCTYRSLSVGGRHPGTIHLWAEKMSKLYTKIGKYLQFTPVINIQMCYFVACHCLLSILYFIRFLLIYHLTQLMACILIKQFKP